LDTFGIVVVTSLTALVWILASRWLGVIVLSLVEDDTPPKPRPGRAPFLADDRLPTRDEMLAVAMLFAGPRRAAELLVAEALADRWLVAPPSPTRPFEVFEPRASAAPHAEELKRALGHAPSSARLAEAAAAVASAHAEKTTSALAERGFTRPLWHFVAAFAAFAVSGALSTLAFGPLWEMAKGGERERLFVLVVVACFAVGMLVAALTLPRRTTAGERYVTALSESTQRLADDAQDGRVFETRDVSLVVATRGKLALGGTTFARLRDD
jgi:uncharacterized protein (TIGR04222 family)